MFTYRSFYDEVVEKYKENIEEGAMFAEVGCWFGDSSAYLLDKIIKTNPSIAIMFIDTWLGGKGEPEEQLVKEKGFSYVYDEFCNKIRKIDPEALIIRMDSVEAAQEMTNETFDFVFINAGHCDWQCYNDMVAWYPKVVPGGILAGHDIDFPDVRKSVERFCSEYKIEFGIIPSPVQCWKIIK